MRITEAATSLGTSARMLRYREALGLLPPTKEGAGHRQFGEAELRAVALALTLERRYDVGPAALAFGLRVLADPDVQAGLRELGERIGRVTDRSTQALDFEKEKALSLLQRRAPARRPVKDRVPRAQPRQRTGYEGVLPLAERRVSPSAVSSRPSRTASSGEAARTRYRSGSR